MTTNAGAIAVVVEADTASFESSMTKVGAAAEREMKRVERAEQSARTENDRFVSSIQRQIDTFGLTGTALLAYEARLRGISGQAQPLIDRLNKMKDAQAGFNHAATSSSGVAAVGRAMTEAAEGADKAAHGTAGITRELLVLAHEASQGNFKRFGGSLLVLAEYSTKAQAAISALAGPIGVVVAGLGLFALAAYEGSKQADELRRSLLLTGNYAGVAAGQFEGMAKAIAQSTNVTVGKASEALRALVATGEVGPQALGSLAAATVKLEALTGKSSEEIAKDFAKMQEAPTKWAAEANKAYNFLSVAQYDHIKRLEQEGQKEEAAIEVLARLNDHLGTAIPDSLTTLGRLLHSTGQAWDSFWHSAVHEGAPETVQDKINDINKQMQRMRLQRDDHTLLALGPTGTPDNLASLQEQRRMLQALADSQAQLAVAEAARLKAQKEGIATSDYFTHLDEERKGVDRLNKDLDELQANIAKRVAAGGPASLPSDAADEAFIRHRDRSFTDKSDQNADKALATSIRERLNLYADEKARLSDEGAQYLLYGKVLDKTAEAVARVEVATGKYAKASQSAKASIIAGAQAEDRAAAFKKEAEANSAAAKQREKDAESLTKRLQGNAIATSIQIDKLQEDTKYLSLNTLERRIAIEALKIEKQRRDELADPKNAGHEDEINASAMQRTKDITDALMKADAAQKSFGFGAQRAFAQYTQAAADAGKFAESFVSGSLSKLEDAIVSFAETGKLNLKSLFTFMADEFIRNQVRMQIASLVGSASGGGNGASPGLSSLFSLFGSSTASGSGSASFANLFSSSFGGAAFAGGIDSVPYNGMPAVLHEGERVMTRIENQRDKSGGGGVTIHIDQSGASYGAGVDAAGVAQIARAQADRAKAEIQRSLATNGRFS